MPLRDGVLGQPLSNMAIPDMAVGSTWKSRLVDQDRQRSIERFLTGIRSKALAFATFRLGDEETALDMVQETMMGFAKVVDDYPAEAWTNLFYKILTRRVTDWQRKSRWRQALAPISLFSRLGCGRDGDDDEANFEARIADTASDNPVHAELMTGELAARFEAVLATLPPRQQEAYLLRQWQGLSTRETADIMRCSEGSVKTQLSRAMRTLRDELGDWLEEV